jgi:hypothetical protein
LKKRNEENGEDCINISGLFGSKGKYVSRIKVPQTLSSSSSPSNIMRERGDAVTYFVFLLFLFVCLSLLSLFLPGPLCCVYTTAIVCYFPVHQFLPFSDEELRK